MTDYREREQNEKDIIDLGKFGLPDGKGRENLEKLIKRTTHIVEVPRASDGKTPLTPPQGE